MSSSFREPNPACQDICIWVMLGLNLRNMVICLSNRGSSFNDYMHILTNLLYVLLSHEVSTSKFRCWRTSMGLERPVWWTLRWIDSESLGNEASNSALFHWQGSGKKMHASPQEDTNSAILFAKLEQDNFQRVFHIQLWWCNVNLEQNRSCTNNSYL